VSDIQERITAINTPGPEDDPKFDMGKITDLGTLSEIAKGNTDKVRKLQRIQMSLEEGDIDRTHLETILVKRQRLSIRLIQRRESLHKKNHEQKITQVQEALRPTSTLLNNQNRELVNQAVKILEKVKKLQAQFKDDSGNGNQRRLLARLKQWETTYGAMIHVFNNLLPLPSDLET
jgi:hypothetical protein